MTVVKRFHVEVAVDAIPRTVRHPKATSSDEPTILGVVQAMENYLRARGWDVEGMNVRVQPAGEQQAG